jgi:hypothetical protein
MDFAYKVAGTDQVIVFDGAPGGFNVSTSLARKLEAAAPRVGAKVEKELLPKWMKQRGIDLRVLQQIP